jgi:hypothetical protein
MRDPDMPPGIRVDCAGKALPYMHAKMAEQPTTEKVTEITRIERVIVRPGAIANYPVDQYEAADIAARGARAAQQDLDETRRN